MAFNGLRNFHPDELIPELQRLGIAFGAHANAYTSFDETVYMLQLPNSTDGNALDIAFNVLRDQADGMLLDSEEVEKERGEYTVHVPCESAFSCSFVCNLLQIAPLYL